MVDRQTNGETDKAIPMYRLSFAFSSKGGQKSIWTPGVGHVLAKERLVICQIKPVTLLTAEVSDMAFTKLSC